MVCLVRYNGYWVRGPTIVEYRKLGKFQLVESVASVGMGEIFRSVDRAGRVFALKKILKSYQENKHFRDLFVREAEITFSLDHPHIVKAHGFDEVGKQLVLVLEYLEGINLREFLSCLNQDKRKLPVPLALKLAISILDGLDYAHKKRDRLGRNLGIVHRDLNPANIFLTYQGIPKILDFGISKATEKGVHNLTPKGEIRGKLSYLAPEQILHDKVDHRVDVFAAGIVLWELITAVPLFQKTDSESPFEVVLNSQYQSVNSFRNDVRGELDFILQRALSINPEHRFQSAQEFRDALQAYLKTYYFVPPTFRDLSIYIRKIMKPDLFDSNNPEDLSSLALLMVQTPGREARGLDLLQSLQKKFPSRVHVKFSHARALLYLGSKLEGLRLLRSLARSDTFYAEVQETLEWLGVRRPPVVHFLRRSNPINHVLGRIRHRIMGPTPFQSQFSNVA